MNMIKLPNPLTILLGSLGAFWIADFISPAFNPIAFLMLVLIPVIICEIFYPQEELFHKVEQAQLEVMAKNEKESVSGELLEDDTANETA